MVSCKSVGDFIMSDFYNTKYFTRFTNDEWKNTVEPFYVTLVEFKNYVDNDLSSWFDSATVTTYTDTASSKDMCKLVLSRNGHDIITFNTYYYSSSSSNGYYGLETIVHTSNGDISDKNAATSSWWASSYMVKLSDIIFNDHFIGISFDSRYESDSTPHYQQSAIVMTKTENENIAIIRSYDKIRTSEIVYGNSSAATVRRITCLTRQSTTDGLFNRSGIHNYGSYHNLEIRKLSLVPIPVISTNDYCKYAYVPDMHPFAISGETGGVVEIGDRKFYTNGIVYIEL